MRPRDPTDVSETDRLPNDVTGSFHIQILHGAKWYEPPCRLAQLGPEAPKDAQAGGAQRTANPTGCSSYQLANSSEAKLSRPDEAGDVCDARGLLQRAGDAAAKSGGLHLLPQQPILDVRGVLRRF
jgi:hypothetical protein